MEDWIYYSPFIIAIVFALGSLFSVLVFYKPEKHNPPHH